MTQEDVQAMRQERGRLWDKCKGLHAKANEEERDLTPEEQEEWDKRCAEIDSLKAKIDRQERADAIEKELAETSAKDVDRVEKMWRDRNNGTREDFQRQLRRPDLPTRDDEVRAFQGWCLAQAELPLKDEHRKAAEKCGIDPNGRWFEVRLRPDYDQLKRELRMKVGATGYGMETVPEGFVSSLERSLLYFGGMREVSTVIRTASGNALPWPTSDDTSNAGTLVAEAGTLSTADVATSTVTLNAYKYTSNIVKVSAELLQDSAFNLAAILGSICGERIGRATNSDFTVGTGSGQPNGIVTAAAAGATHTVLSVHDLPEQIVDLIHSVDPAYRRQPGVGFLMHDAIVAHLRKIRDQGGGTLSSGNFMWQPGMQLGQPDRLFGYPVTINESMASTWSAGNEVIIFGALRKYIIRDAGPIRMRRLVELYAGNDQEGFVAFSRHDGDLLDAGTDPVKSFTLA